MNICVVGDAMRDEFVEVEVTRISPEAPVPVMRELRRYVVPGGAANCAKNVEALGGHVYLVALNTTGQEPWPNGSWISPDNVPASDLRRHTTKTRFIASGQQIARLDSEDTRPLSEYEETELLQEVYEALAADCDCLVISDYAKGVCSVRVCQRAIDRANSMGIPIVADPKSDNWNRYRGAYVLTPNEREYARRQAEPDGAFVLLTRGARGMTLISPDGGRQDIDALPREVVSVIGAGDTVTAAMAVALAARLTMLEAAMFANAAASIVVGKAGTATVSLQEVYDLDLPYAGLVARIREVI